VHGLCFGYLLQRQSPEQWGSEKEYDDHDEEKFCLLPFLPLLVS
jgi:hypothetical protein